MYGGRTVEVLNTDAEGRLILADAIARAVEDEPDYLIETSTLTGAQLVALGQRTAGVMGSDGAPRPGGRLARDGRRGRVADAAARTHIRGELDSRVADIANVTGHRNGGMLAGGDLPARVRAGRAAVGAHRHRRPGVPHRRAVRLHAQGRHRRPGADPAAVLTDIAENG